MIKTDKARNRFVNTRYWVAKHYEDIARNSRIQTVSSQVAFPVLIAIIIGSGLYQHTAGLIILAVTSLMQAAFVWGSWSKKVFPPNFLIEYEDLVTSYEELGKRHVGNKMEIANSKESLYHLGLFFRSFHERSYPNDNDTHAVVREKVSTNLNQLFEPLYDGRCALFGFEEDEKFNAAVYIMVPGQPGDSSMLHLVGRKTNIPKEQLRNRSWRVGTGHAGYTYMRNKPSIIPDVRGYPELRNDQEDGDNDKYISFATIPLRKSNSNPFHSDQDAYGVLLLTSNIANRFNDTPEEMLENFAFVFSKYLDNVYEVTIKAWRHTHGNADS